MGSSQLVPPWVNEVLLMEAFGWTEKQLYDEVSLSTTIRISVYNEIRSKVDKVKEKSKQPMPLRRR